MNEKDLWLLFAEEYIKGLQEQEKKLQANEGKKEEKEEKKVKAKLCPLVRHFCLAENCALSRKYTRINGEEINECAIITIANAINDMRFTLKMRK